MNFEVYGPYEFTIGDENERWRSDFWDNVADETRDGLKTAIGCYAFCLRNGDSRRCWYVGKTLAVRGFSGEIFELHKIKHYLAINEQHRGRREIFLFPHITSTGRFARGGNKRSSAPVGWLEKTLIGMALAKNPAMANIRDTGMLRNIQVPGLFGEIPAGRPRAAVAAVQSVFLDL